MRIAVDLRIIRLYGQESRGYYVYDLLKRIVTGNPSQEFIFLFDGPYSKKLVFSENIIPVVVRPEANSPLGWKYWYDYKIPRVMRNIQADCFVAASGICSMRIGIPQILILQDLIFLNRPDDYRKSWLRYFKSQTIRHCRKAKRIITATYAVAKEIQNLDQGNTGKISLVKGFADECFQPLPWYEREYIKDKYAGGKDFFLFLGPVRPGTNPLQLIKAFSRFKKWQQSNMKMLIAGKWDEGCSKTQLLKVST